MDEETTNQDISDENTELLALGQRIESRLDKAASRWRGLLVAISVGVVLLVSGAVVVAVLLSRVASVQDSVIEVQREAKRDADRRAAEAEKQRLAIIANQQEIKDCTTPTVESECSKRTAEAQAKGLVGLSEDNLNASVAVGLCLQEKATDLQSCAKKKVEELRARAPKP